MKKDNEKLLNMLKEGKISENDFKVVSLALEKKKFSIPSLLLFAFNPFQKIAGWYALILGAITIIIMSYLGTIAKVYFPGIIDCLNSVVVKNPKTPLNFYLLLYQNIICWLVLSILFIGIAKYLPNKKIRMLDFFGTVALARFPYLLLTLLLSIIQIVNPSFMDIDLSKGVEIHLSMPMILFGLFAAGFGIWQITTYFYSFKVSSGLIGKKLWIGFILAMVLGEAISWQLTTLFM